ncbi:MAG: RsmE family RNA methyltransferase [Actinomycetota bacterium]|nr:RsmE family RNA methyltransferase [Actinomycetota bacterium]
MDEGADIVVIDGRGAISHAVIASTTGGRVVARVSELQQLPRPDLEIAVYQGAPKGAKGDEVVERIAELGASDIAFFSSERAVSRWDSAKIARLTARWEARVHAAAARSHNPRAARVHGVLSWTDLSQAVGAEPCALVLSDQSTVPLRKRLPSRAERVALVVGPEGGLSSSELEQLEAVGAASASLGPVVLRTENAAPAALAALLWHYERMG